MNTAADMRGLPRARRSRLAVAGFTLVLSSMIPAAAALAQVAGRSTIPDVVQRVVPSVVSITTRHITRDDQERAASSRGLGSGVIVDPRGYILTNHHIVEDAEVIKVTLPDERTFRATVVGADPFTDLAVVKIDGRKLPVARLGASEQLRVGETVIAIGNPLWIEGGPSVTVGVVSALKRSMEQDGLPLLHHLVQTDAAINPGNSGGPLVNLRGEVVAINTALIASAHGIGFAIPTATIRPILAALIRGERIVRPTLGVRGVSVTPQVAYVNDLGTDRGVLVMSVDPNGPADAARLQAGDVISAVGSTPVRDLHAFHDALTAHAVGQRVSVTVWRGRDRLTVSTLLSQYQ